jgi:sialic acid synthase SpsE
MTIIISEIGVNWNADFQLLEQMVKTSKEIGCNLVKFQSIDETKLEHPKKDLIMKSSITKNNIEEINQVCKNYNIEWFCTPMYPEAVELLDPFVKMFKIREFDGRVMLQNKTNLIIDNILKTKKEVIVSSNQSPITSKFFKNEQIKWLYCIPSYPCKLEEINFEKIKDFDGYSNHCVEIIAPITAAALGAKIIEIHMTSSKSKNFIDNNVSFEYSEFKEIIRQIRLLEKIKK